MYTRYYLSKYIHFIILSLFLFTGSTNLSRAQTTDPRIEGISKFLLDRANENLLYIFEERLKTNQFLQTFMPNTFRALGRTHLTVLLTDQTLWMHSIESDLRGMIELTADSIIVHLEKELLTDQIDRFLKEAENTRVAYKGEMVPINVLPFPRDRDLERLINPIYSIDATLQNLGPKIIEIIDTLKSIDIKDISQFTDMESILTDHINEVDILLRDFHRWTLIVGELKLDRKEFTGQFEKTQKLLSLVRDIFHTITLIHDKNYSYAYKTSQMLKVMNNFVELQGIQWLGLPTGRTFNKYFNSFERYSLFFAQLADSETADQTQAVLRAATIPSRSFITKREVRTMHFTISSYLGVNLGVETGNLKKFLFFGGLFAPIGPELSYGTNRGSSWSIMLMVFDFGNAVNAQLYTPETKITYSSILVPGIMISKGFPRLPLAVNIAYSNALGVHSNRLGDHKFQIALTFDMPLFVLF